MEARREKLKRRARVSELGAIVVCIGLAKSCECERRRPPPEEKEGRRCTLPVVLVASDCGERWE